MSAAAPNAPQPLTIVVDGARDGVWQSALAAEWPVVDGQAVGTDAAACVHLRQGVAEPVGEGGQRIAAAGRHLLADVDAQRIILQDDSGGASLRFGSSGAARITTWGQDCSLPLVVAVSQASAAWGWIGLHSAAVMAWPAAGGTPGIRVVLGAGGAGKSSWLIAQVREGAIPLADDRLWIHAGSHAVHGRDDSVCLTPDRVRELGLGAGVGSWRADGKARLPFDGLFDGPVDGVGSLAMPASPGNGILDGGQIAVMQDYVAVPLASLSAVVAARALWQSVSVPLLAAHREGCRQLIERILAQSGAGKGA